MATKTKRVEKKSKLPAVIRGIQPVGEIDDKHVALFYGRAGRGKTETATTFPGPGLIIDIGNEKGTKTVKHKKGWSVAKVRTEQDFEDLYWWLREEQEFETIVLDQITGLQQIFVDSVRDRRNLKKHDLLTRKNWGEISGNMKTWLEKFRELYTLYNVVFIAHERAFSGEDESEDDQVDPNVGARVMPSVGSFVEGACDIIGQNFIRTFTEKVKTSKGMVKKRRVEYCMRIGPHPIYTTKIRRPASSGPLPAFITDPSYQKLVALENGEEMSRNVTKKGVK